MNVPPSQFAVPPPIESELVARDASRAEIVSEVLTSLVRDFGGETAASVLGRLLHAGRYGREAAAKTVEWRWAIDTLSRVERKLDELREALPPDQHPSAEDVAATLRSIEEVSRKTADAKKRRLLRNALVNAFDPDLYKQGLTRRLLRILEDLEYGEVALLARIPKDPWTQVHVLLEKADRAVATASTLNGHHLQTLIAKGLVMEIHNGELVSAAAFGEALLDLVREPEPEPDEAASSAA